MNSHASQQQKIDVEMDAMGILRIMIRYRNIEEIEWSRDSLELYCGFDEQRMGRALAWLIKNEYLQIIHGHLYWPTTDGEHMFNAACANGYFATGNNVFAFRDNVLTGTTTTGQPTPLKYETSRSEEGGLKITRSSSSAGPALPSTHRGGTQPGDPVDMMADALKLREIAMQLGIGIAAARKAIQDERVARCNRCGEIALHHARKSHSTGRQPVCIACQKKARKK